MCIKKDRSRSASTIAQKYAVSKVHTTQRNDRQKRPPGNALGSVSARLLHNEHASSRDSTVRHKHTPHGAVVAHIRNLAVRRERVSEGCVMRAGMHREAGL